MQKSIDTVTAAKIELENFLNQGSYPATPITFNRFLELISTDLESGVKHQTCYIAIEYKTHLIDVDLNTLESQYLNGLLMLKNLQDALENFVRFSYKADTFQALCNCLENIADNLHYLNGFRSSVRFNLVGTVEI